MFKNYFKIAIRTLLKRKGYSLLNILGLSLGMTCCLLIFHYVSYEKSYDADIPGIENLYRVRMDNYANNALTERWATVAPAVGPTLKKEYAEIENYCRLYHATFLLSNDETNVRFHEKQGFFSDPSFISLFNTQLIAGNPAEALKGPDKIIISEEMAKKYFGDQPAIGKTLSVKNVPFFNKPFQVTGVFKAHPKNSHLTIDFLVSFDSFSSWYSNWFEGWNTETSFNVIDFYTYLKLKPATNIAAMDKNLVSFCNKYLEPDKINKSWTELHLEPVKSIHLYANSNQEAEPNGNGQRISFLFLIAIFIICIAWVNYINLTTARSVERAKEVGIKKVLGAIRPMLIKQFFSENILLNSVSLLLSLFFFFVLLKRFDAFTGRDAYTGTSLSPAYWSVFIALFVTGTFLSGLYPAFILSGFSPMRVLKGSFKNTSGGKALRKGLIIGQFSISVILIAGTIIVYKQLDYMRRKDPGINMEQTLVLRGAISTKRDVYKAAFSSFKNDLLTNAAIKSITASNHVIGQEIFEGTGATRVGGDFKANPYMSMLRVDYDFISSYDIQIIAGRSFSKDFATDEKAILLNEEAVKKLDFRSPQDAIAQKMTLNSDTFTIAGVIKDYHQEGLQKKIIPISLLLSPGVRNYYSIKINSQDIPATLKMIDKTWKSYFSAEPFNYFFLDESFNAQYKADVLFAKVFSIFAFLAIFIACSGLLALSSYNIIQRSKEIGIRKVLGAPIKAIVVLLAKDFVKLIGASLLISFPVGWYIMQQWLNDYAYRISVSWWFFIVAGLAVVCIAIITISSQAIKAAIANPIKSLRTDS